MSKVFMITAHLGKYKGFGETSDPVNYTDKRRVKLPDPIRAKDAAQARGDASRLTVDLKPSESIIRLTASQITEAEAMRRVGAPSLLGEL